MKKNGMDPNSNPEAKEVFEAADADKNDKIDILKFQDALTNVRTLNLTANAEKIVEDADQDGSGRIDFEEFHDAVVKHQSTSNDGLDFGMLVRNKALADARDDAAG